MCLICSVSIALVKTGNVGHHGERKYNHFNLCVSLSKHQWLSIKKGSPGTIRSCSMFRRTFLRKELTPTRHLKKISFEYFCYRPRSTSKEIQSSPGGKNGYSFLQFILNSLQGQCKHTVYFQAPTMDIHPLISFWLPICYSGGKKRFITAPAKSWLKLLLIATGVHSTRTTMTLFNSSSDVVDVLVHPGWPEAVWSARKKIK